MIVRDLKDAEKSDRTVSSETWKSVRLLLKNDAMGFSMHVTTIHADTITPMWYKNHLEAVYCVAGEGEVETLDDGKTYSIRPGVIYALDKNDQHVLRAKTELTLVCVFNPPLNGKETHGPDGAYPLEAEEVTA